MNKKEIKKGLEEALEILHGAMLILPTADSERRRDRASEVVEYLLEIEKYRPEREYLEKNI